ncbi:hypothetical protein EUGRSUZ_K02964 [Eucalyptus grandis]|uniref:Uncharacterized protein n=2 Tax=Eucalyptus grandis TaxID=71139 RepID=A0ACC3IZJ4_EUCGR|nr:hypothetical protein EUGRSUZ_K02964 [Eucalyptus grandis]
MLSEFHGVPSWSIFEVMNNPVGHVMGPCPNSEFCVGGHEFCSPLTDAEDSSLSLSPSYLPSDKLDPIETILMEIDGFEPISSCNDKGWTPSLTPSLFSEISNDVSSVQASLVLPSEGMGVDYKLGLPHLLKAYGEAMENEQSELLDVISGCIGERANPLGNAMDRLAFYIFNRKQDLNYIKQEAFKNFKPASYAIYQISPHGRFAHFAANSTILESLPKHIDAVHVIDFDMGEAFQWWALIESMAMARRRVALRMTSMKLDDEKGLIEFEEAKSRLQEQVKPLGWRRRSNRQVGEFLRLAKEVIANPTIGGIITSGQGETSRKSRNFIEFFDKNIRCYHAILESMESDFPSQQLVEAGLAVESLSVSPFFSCLGWFLTWEEMRERLDVPLGSCGVDGWRIGQASLMEAMGLISGKRSFSGNWRERE